MRVLYDGIIYSHQVAGGINRYFANIIGYLPASITPILTASQRSEVNYPQHANLELYLLPQPSSFGRLRWFKSLQQRRFFRWASRRARPDVVHPTYYDCLTRRNFSSFNRPVVLTVHDFVHERFPETLDPQGKHAALKREAIDSADAIICVSENTKRDLLEYHDVDEQKVSVIYLASQISPREHPSALPQSQRPYYLYVGSRATYKNFDGLLRAMRHVARRYPDMQLVTVGPPFSAQEQVQIGDLHLNDHVVNVGYAADDRLAQLYGSAMALVYPSLYEGFGIPPLEAMSCGAPVVASANSSIPEVVGNAALLFDPMRQDDLTDILLDFPQNDQLRRTLVARGYQRAKQFSWSRTAQQTLDVYQSLVDTVPSVRRAGPQRMAG